MRSYIYVVWLCKEGEKNQIQQNKNDKYSNWVGVAIIVCLSFA